MPSSYDLLNQSPQVLSRMTARNLIADRLADLMFVADDILSSVDFEAPTSDAIRWIEPEVRDVYERVNELMRRVGN